MSLYAGYLLSNLSLEIYQPIANEIVDYPALLSYFKRSENLNWFPFFVVNICALFALMEDRHKGRLSLLFVLFNLFSCGLLLNTLTGKSNELEHLETIHFKDSTYHLTHNIFRNADLDTHNLIVFECE